MKPIASAKPGTISVNVNGRRRVHPFITVMEYNSCITPSKNVHIEQRETPIKEVTNHVVTDFERKRNRLLGFLVRDVLLIFISDGCLDCLKENLEKDIEE